MLKHYSCPPIKTSFHHYLFLKGYWNYTTTRIWIKVQVSHFHRQHLLKSDLIILEEFLWWRSIWVFVFDHHLECWMKCLDIPDCVAKSLDNFAWRQMVQVFNGKGCSAMSDFDVKEYNGSSSSSGAIYAFIYVILTFKHPMQWPYINWVVPRVQKGFYGPLTKY